MLSLIAITFVVMLLAVAGMALGVIFKRPPLKGSCGGLANEDGFDCACARSGEMRCEIEPLS